MNTFENNNRGDARKSWIKPAIKRIEAGSAENGRVNRRDGGTEPGTALS